MDALCRTTANRRGRAFSAVVRIATAQAVQALGEQCGGLRAPLADVMRAGSKVWIDATVTLPDNQTGRQCPNAITMLYRSVA